MKTVGYAVVGLVGTPMLSGFVSRWLPSAIIGNRWGNYAVKAGSAWGLSLIADKVVDKQAGRSVFVGGLAYVAVGMIQDFFPNLLTASPVPSTGRYLNKQPLLAEYVSPGRMGGPITATTPDRLNPANRF